MTGGSDYLLRLVVRDVDDLEQVMPGPDHHPQRDWVSPALAMRTVCGQTEPCRFDSGDVDPDHLPAMSFQGSHRRLDRSRATLGNCARCLRMTSSEMAYLPPDWTGVLCYILFPLPWVSTGHALRCMLKRGDTSPAPLSPSAIRVLASSLDERIEPDRATGHRMGRSGHEGR
jgi:hypothetical protein